jgi:hypothetical protein
MKWTTLKSGRHAGLSLPQMILADADWFFWVLNEGFLWGRLAKEAEDLARKARAIKIPKHVPKNWEVEYRYEDDGRFTEFAFVRPGVPSYCGFRLFYRLSYLDLSFIRRKRTYDKQGCRNLPHCFRHHYFGDGVRLTKRRCEKFFSKRRNFLKSSKATRRK